MVKHIVTFKLKGSDEERREVALKFKAAQKNFIKILQR